MGEEAQAVETIVAMVEALRDLAGRPEGERRELLTERLDLLYSLPEARAQMLMEQMAQALAELPAAEAERVTASRLAVLARYEPQKRAWLLDRYHAAVARFPDEVRLPNEQAEERALARLSRDERRAILEAMQQQPGAWP
jgi:hypothetical protein